MSELTKEHVRTRNLRWRWLTTTSTLALAAVVFSGPALGRDDDHPTVWIELGGQLERVDGGQDRFMPLFADKVIKAGFEPPAVAQTPPRYAIGGETKISFTPESSDWVFSAALRYGRSNGNKHRHQQVALKTRFKPLPQTLPTYYFVKVGNIASDSKTQERESHAILDFQAGKDVGLGLIGRGGTSILGMGVRFAEFTSKSRDNLIARPTYAFNEYRRSGLYLRSATRYDFHGVARNERSFHGIGPSLKWDASARVAGSEEADVSFDWGLNAAILVGRQKSAGHHQTTAYHYQQYYNGPQQPSYKLVYPRKALDHARSRSVVVPNLGGFAGISLRWPNAKVSLGYRGDFFFGAMDGGVDARVTKDRNFYGPFANISIGLP
jgi:hypothetical protein